MIGVGDRLPAARLLRFGVEGPETVQLADLVSGRKVVLFAVPGAFTPTCDSAHLPSFIRTAAAFRAKSVDEIICISVNDVHVMRYWGELSGATAAGITMLADGDGSYTKAMGLDFNLPKVGFWGRSRRYALVAQDGVVTVLHLEEPGVCAVSTGEAVLEALWQAR